MLAIEGTIEAIVTENNNGKDKKVLTIQSGRNNTIYVEFQGKMMHTLNGYSEGQRVEVRVRFNGKTSKLGRRYNNIIGKSIKQL